jgi:hypothetical protein
MFALFTGVFLLTGGSCTSKKPGYQQLIGIWTLIDAQRNGRTTQTLENVFFDFSSDTTMSTNFLGAGEYYQIEYDFPDILVKSSQLPRISVMKLAQDTLQLSTQIGNFRYDLTLLRSDDK